MPSTTAIFIFLVGVSFGIIINFISSRISNKPDGRIVLNKTDPDFATAGIEFYVGAESIDKKKYILLKVDSPR